jgi:hypothetical protein
VTVPARWLTVVRAAYGTALLCAPGRVARLAGGPPPDRRVRMTARVLGTRHLAQSCFTARYPFAGAMLLGAGTDITHAASMLAFAAAPRRRREALADAAAATGFAVAGLVIARHRRGDR